MSIRIPSQSQCMFRLTQKHRLQQSSKNPKPEKTAGKKEGGEVYQIEGEKKQKQNVFI